MSHEQEIRDRLAMLRSGARDLDEVAEQVIEACGGDAHAAVRVLVVALDFAEERARRLDKAVSHAFARNIFHGRLDRSEGDAG